MRLMHTQQYLQDKLLSGYGSEEALDHLSDELGIRCKVYHEEGLVVLNYDQINSPKTDKIVMECRGLILSLDTFEVVSRSFDRFFNWGEAPDTCKDFNFDTATIYEKADGSLIKVYYWNDEWRISTRGTAFAETENYSGRTFKDLVLEAFGVTEEGFQDSCSGLFTNTTYIFELTHPDNRVVTPYAKPGMVLLGARNNYTGEEFSYIRLSLCPIWVENLSFRVAKTFSFSSSEDMKEAAATLPNLQEGYVCHDPVSGKRVKVKSPAYLAVHRLRGDNVPSPKRIMQLVLTKEEEEYLLYFPEERKRFSPYVVALSELEEEISSTWKTVSSVTDQKEFALAVKDYKYSACLFSAKSSGKPPVQVFHNSKDSYKLKTLTSFIVEQLTN